MRNLSNINWYCVASDWCLCFQDGGRNNKCIASDFFCWLWLTCVLVALLCYAPGGNARNCRQTTSSIDGRSHVRHVFSRYPREPNIIKHDVFDAKNTKKNGISYHGTDRNIDVFWFYQWKRDIPSISFHNFDILLKSWKVFDEIFLFHWWNQNTSMFLSVSSCKLHFFDVSAPCEGSCFTLWTFCQHNEPKRLKDPIGTIQWTNMITLVSVIHHATDVFGCIFIAPFFYADFCSFSSRLMLLTTKNKLHKHEHTEKRDLIRVLCSVFFLQLLSTVVSINSIYLFWS